VGWDYGELGKGRASMKERKERYRQLLDYAMKLEGLSRHAGVHAAGIVIAPGPLDEYVPICTQASKGAGAGNGLGASALGTSSGEWPGGTATRRWRCRPEWSAAGAASRK